MYGRSSDRRRVGGSVERRRGTVGFPRRSTLPGGRPLPWTASIKIRVISCESVLCSPAARRRSDSFNSFGTYAPMNTPLRLAINLWGSPFLIVCSNKKCLKAMGRACKPNFVPDRGQAAIIHLGHSLPNCSSDLPGTCRRFRLRTGRTID